MELHHMNENHHEAYTSLPTQLETENFIKNGYAVDTQGRPLHPYLDELGPLPEGKGAYWNWGPNYTADPIVVTSEKRPRILLIHRNDTGDLALPGGFVDAEELSEPIKASYRELEEETGLILTTHGTLVYQGVVSDPRTTANAWPETSAFVFTLPEPLPVQAGDDAREAGWYLVDELPETLYGSHAVLIQKALEIQKQPRTIEDILSIPAQDREIESIDAGHMAYDHFFTRHGNDHLFVKARDSTRFTDPIREAHSRAYLQKEHTMFQHLQAQHYTHIPERIALIDDTTLAMDALHPDDGWQWRAPKQPEVLNRYITDIIKAFEQLQRVSPPLHPTYHEEIKDTYSTLLEEGWESIDSEAMEEIIGKIRAFSNNWSSEQTNRSEALIGALPQMKRRMESWNRKDNVYMAHNDARQSNIAWHPKHGTRLVDWSWGDTGPHNADTTMFLIDLAKSGTDITPYADAINHEYAQILIGFWLAHSLWETREGSGTVREHQAASAVAAFHVIKS
jgi:8-oxo-dGTP diphosphatase